MEWISTEDRLPLGFEAAKKYESLQVIVRYMEDYEGENGNGVGVAFYTVGQSPYPWGKWSNDTGNITDWMPLPPKDK